MTKITGRLAFDLVSFNAGLGLIASFKLGYGKERHRVDECEKEAKHWSDKRIEMFETGLHYTKPNRLLAENATTAR